MYPDTWIGREGDAFGGTYFEIRFLIWISFTSLFAGCEVVQIGAGTEDVADATLLNISERCIVPKLLTASDRSKDVIDTTLTKISEIRSKRKQAYVCIQYALLVYF